MDFVNTLWFRVPAWIRATTMESLELAGISVLDYLYQILNGGGHFDWNAVGRIVGLKIIAKVIRAHPSIPVPDYVNLGNVSPPIPPKKRA